MENKIFKSARELKKEMVDAAMTKMTGFYSDIVWDLERVDELSEKEYGGHFYWAVRATGTHTRETCEEINMFKKTWGEDLLIVALIGKHAKSETYEIVYERK